MRKPKKKDTDEVPQKAPPRAPACNICGLHLHQGKCPDGHAQQPREIE